MRTIHGMAIVLAAACALGQAACDNGGVEGGDGGADTDADTDTDADADGPVAISGAMHKGPLIQGSSLTVAMLDETGAPTGTNYLTTTNSDLGDFGVVAQTTGPAELIGEGFYFNEVTSSLSGAAITLRALYLVEGAGEQSAYLNVFTHMSSGLALSRLQSGDTVDAAVAYAENALFDALGIPHPLSALQANGTAMDLAGADSPDNQYLAAVSCIVAEAALLRAASPDEVDASLQALVNDIRGQLQNSETITEEYRGYLEAGEAAFDPQADCMQNLADYLYDKTGIEPVLPDPNACADMDGDGTPNAEDEDIDGDGFANPDDADPWDPGVLTWTWTDDTTGLVWQRYIDSASFGLTQDEAIAFCDALELAGYSDWRLPTIGELRSLIRGCADTITDGACGVNDGCLADTCWASCDTCGWVAGPDPNGCYWSDGLGGYSPSGPGDCSTEWSSSLATSDTNPEAEAWYVQFGNAAVMFGFKANDFNARCVR